MNGIPLGFGPSPRPEYVYVAQDKSPTGWYTLDHSGGGEPKPIPCPESALYGLITAIDEETKEFKGKENRKLQIHIAAGARKYIIRSGMYTAFSRCILASLARLEPRHLSRVFCVETQLGKEENKTVFANLYDAETGSRIKYDWPKDEADVEQLFASVVRTFAQKQEGQASRPKAAAA